MTKIPVQKTTLLASTILLLAAVFICMPAAAEDICTVEVTSPATVGVITLTDADGNTIASEPFLPAGRNNPNDPVHLTYDKSRYSLAEVSIIPAGYYGVTAPAQNPKGDILRVVFHLSDTDETAGYAEITDMSVTGTDTAAASPAPAHLILAGLAAAVILKRKKPSK